MNGEKTRKNSIRTVLAILLTAVVIFIPGYGRTEDMRAECVKPGGCDASENCVVYINWDGFAWYYYELANRGETSRTPVINELAREGVLFTRAYTGIPAITNPMQSAIVSGAWPETTGNCYRYYDKAQNKVIQFARENNAENIAEAAVRQGLNVASVHQFILQNRGTVEGDPARPYIQIGSGKDYAPRFDAAIALIRGEETGTGASKVKVETLPRFIALYMDDLDGIGHNEALCYGVPVAPNEEQRLANVLDRLELMDAKLGEFIDACKEKGVYDRMSFVLTSDHGMARYGTQGDQPDEYTYSKLPDLVQTLEGMGYKVEVLAAGKSPAADTQIVLVTVGLEAQLSFTGEYSREEINQIKNALKKKEYAGEILDEKEMQKRGAMKGFADLLISPRVPYSFKTSASAYTARGQHDSLEEETQHVFSLMWGKGVKKGHRYNSRMDNIDFCVTMARLLGIEPPKDATARVLTGALENSWRGRE